MRRLRRRRGARARQTAGGAQRRRELRGRARPSAVRPRLGRPGRGPRRARPDGVRRPPPHAAGRRARERLEERMLLHLVVSVVARHAGDAHLRPPPVPALRARSVRPAGGRGVRVRGLGAHDAGALLRRHLVPAWRLAGPAGAHRDDGHPGRGGDAQRLCLQCLDDGGGGRADVLRFRRHDHRHHPGGPVPRGGRRRPGAQGRAAAAHAATGARVPARGGSLARRTAADLREGDVVLSRARGASRGGRRSRRGVRRRRRGAAHGRVHARGEGGRGARAGRIARHRRRRWSIG